MAKRLIDADALGIGRCNPDVFPIENRGYCAGWNGVVNLLEVAPTVDAVEVVRCRDCKHRMTNQCPTYHIAYFSEKESWELDGDDDFCSYGEHKDGQAPQRENV